MCATRFLLPPLRLGCWHQGTAIHSVLTGAVCVCGSVCVQEELAERASWLLAEEEVLLMEQQAAGGGEGGAGDEAAPAQQALPEHPSSILDGLTATDINKLKVRGRCARGAGGGGATAQAFCWSWSVWSTAVQRCGQNEWAVWHRPRPQQCATMHGSPSDEIEA